MEHLNTHDRDRLFAQRLMGAISAGVPTFLFLMYLFAPKAQDARHQELVAALLFGLSALGILRLSRGWRKPEGIGYFFRSSLIDIGGTFAILWLFSYTYHLPLTSVLKSPTANIIFVFLALRIVLADIRLVAITGTIAVTGYMMTICVALAGSNSPGVTHSFAEYLTSHRMLVGAEVERILQIAVMTMALCGFVYFQNRDFSTQLMRRSAFMRDVARLNARQLESGTSERALIVVDLEVNEASDLAEPAALNRVLSELVNLPAIRSQNVIRAGRLAPSQVAYLLNSGVGTKTFYSFMDGLRNDTLSLIQDTIGGPAYRVHVAGCLVSHQSKELGLFKSVSEALRQARTTERAVTEFDEDFQLKLFEAQAMKGLIRSALAEKRFENFYQPIMDLRTNEIVGVEALVRMRDRNGDLVSPGKFIPVAERSGLIKHIGRGVLMSAGHDAIAMKEHIDNPNFFISVNVSPVQLVDDKHLEGILTDAQSAGFPIKLEITESQEINSREAIDRMQAFKKMGAALAIDDFGTGYSSISRLREMPVDTLKIDQSFTQHLEDGNGLAMVRAINEMAVATSKDVIIEGVETDIQRAAAISLGIRYCQGYLYARPMPLSELLEYTSSLADRNIETRQDRSVASAS